MYIEEIMNNGKPYLRLVKAIRAENKSGKLSSKKQVVAYIGPTEKFDDGMPDYVQRLKQSFKDGDPLIPSLQKFVDNTEPEQYSVTFIEGDELCYSSPKRCAQIILDRIFDDLGLSYLLASVKHQHKFQFDLQGLVRLLTYGRLIDPDSKIATFDQNKEYYNPVVSSNNPYNVYDALDVIADNWKQIQNRMNKAITKGINRSSKVIFYDVTNFFFEIEEPDDDYLDEAGESKKGLRKNGVSKEERKLPIVQMGLFLDDSGIPISIEVFPGNTLDGSTLRPALTNTIDDLNLDRFVLVADRGICSGKNNIHLLSRENGYIVSKSIGKTAKEERKWILDEQGYTVLSDDFKYKSRIVHRSGLDDSGKRVEYDEKVIVYWSKKFYDREVYENKRFLDFVKKLRENPGNFRITQAESNTLRRFLKKDVINRETGELLNSGKLLAALDEDKLNEHVAYYGYYQIVTSELDMADTEVIDKYHGLTRIEDQFRAMKGTLKTRPIYVRTPNHIRAHLLLCFISLTMMRLIQRKVVISSEDGSNGEKYWTYGIPGERLQKALADWKVDKLPNDYYRFSGMDNPDLLKILDAFDIQIEKKLYRKGDFLGFKKNVKSF